MRSADGARDDVTVLGIAGDWTVETVGKVLPSVADKVAPGRHLVFDGSELGRFDTAGAWALVGLMRQQEEAGGSSELKDFSKSATTLIAEIAQDSGLGSDSLPAAARISCQVVVSTGTPSAVRRARWARPSGWSTTSPAAKSITS